MQIVFETPRLLLRQFTQADAPLIYRLNSDPEIIKYVHERVLTNEAQATEILVKVILPQYQFNLGRWAIHAKSDGEFLGWCGLKLIQETSVIDLGYRLLKSAWGNGYATEAAAHSIQYGLHELKLEVITGMAHVENMASLRVLAKIGMQFLKNDVVQTCPVKIYTQSLLR